MLARVAWSTQSSRDLDTRPLWKRERERACAPQGGHEVGHAEEKEKRERAPSPRSLASHSSFLNRCVSSPPLPLARPSPPITAPP